MKNVKDQIAEALLEVTENVTDAYPQNWTDFPTIQYTEENNMVHTRTDNREQMAFVSYRIDVWNNRSTSETALAVDEAIAKLGLVRSMCQDANDQTGLKHKVMRYEGVIDMNSDIVYWPA